MNGERRVVWFTLSCDWSQHWKCYKSGRCQTPERHLHSSINRTENQSHQTHMNQKHQAEHITAQSYPIYYNEGFFPNQPSITAVSVDTKEKTFPWLILQAFEKTSSDASELPQRNIIESVNAYASRPLSSGLHRKLWVHRRHMQLSGYVPDLRSCTSGMEKLQNSCAPCRVSTNKNGLSWNSCWGNELKQTLATILVFYAFVYATYKTTNSTQNSCIAKALCSSLVYI